MTGEFVKYGYRLAVTTEQIEHSAAGVIARLRAQAKSGLLAKMAADGREPLDSIVVWDEPWIEERAGETVTLGREVRAKGTGVAS